MTTKYRLTNDNRELSEKVIGDLTEYVELKEADIKEKYVNMSHSLADEMVMVKKMIEKYPDLDLDGILERDYLTFTEALLILHGLCPPTGFDIRRVSEEIVGYYDYPPLLGKYKFKENKIYTQLLHAITAGNVSKEYGLKSDPEGGFCTEQFIPWAIGKGFIEDIKDIEDIKKKSKTANINTTHNRERESIADHNKKVTLSEFEKWTPVFGKSKNADAFTKDLTAWTKLKLKLKPLLKEGDAGNQVMPKKETIAQYIRDDIKTKFQLHK